MYTKDTYPPQTELLGTYPQASKEHNNRQNNVFVRLLTALAVVVTWTGGLSPLGGSLGLAKGSSPKTTSSVPEPASPADLKERLGIAPSTVSPPPQAPMAGYDAPPPSLEPLVRFAIDQHPLLSKEETKVKKAQSTLDLAKSRFGPTAQIQAQKGIKQFPSDVGTSRAFGKSSSAGISVSQNLWNGGQDLLDYRQQVIGLEAAELEFKSAEKSLIWQVRMAGLAYQQAAMDLWIAEQSLKNSKEIVYLSKQKSQAGQVGKIDVMQSEQQLTAAMTQVNSAEIRVFKSRESLEKVVLLTPSDPRRSSLDKILQDLIAQPMARPDQGWLSQLDATTWVDRQLKRQQSQKLIGQKELEITKAQRNRWFPSIDLSLSYQKNFEPKETGFADNQDENPINGSLNLNWPLWDQPRSSRINQAQIEAQELRFHDEESRRLLTLSIAQTKAQLERLFKLFEIHKVSYDQSEALYQAKIQLYRAGAIDIIALTNGANDRLRTIQSLYATICELQKEWFQLMAYADGVQAGT